jgi:hypothetical protein
MSALPPTKKCSACQIEKPWSEFFPRPQRGPNAVRSYCKGCSGKKNTAWYRNKSPSYKRMKSLSKLHGVSLEAYDQLHLAQNGVCAICGELETRTTRAGGLLMLAVDHDHKSMKIRGLLCGSCNLGLGQFKDSPLLLEKAILYLRKHG